MIYRGDVKIGEASAMYFYAPRAIKLTIRATGYSDRMIRAVVALNTWQKWHKCFFTTHTACAVLAHTNIIYTYNFFKECKRIGLLEKVDGKKAWNVTEKGNQLNKVFNRFVSELMNNEDIYKPGFDSTTHRKRPKGRKYDKYYSTSIYRERNRRNKGNVTD